MTPPLKLILSVALAGAACGRRPAPGKPFDVFLSTDVNYS
jgi:hypothetical protein